MALTATKTAARFQERCLNVDDAGRGLKGHWGPTAIWRLGWRGVLVAGLIGAAVLEMLVLRPKTRRGRARWTQRLCRRVIRGLGIPVVVEGEFPSAGAVVVNHEGYLDILVLASLAPCVFVSKAEVGRWPVVGWMTTMAGTVYVERGKGGSGAAASARLREAATDGLPVVFFPEGTTSDGEGVLPFRGGMLAEARAAGLPVTVGVMRYGLRGPAGATVADDVAFWGDRGMLAHMARFLTLEGLSARVRFAAEPVRFTTEDRKDAAAEARRALLQLGKGSLQGG